MTDNKWSKCQFCGRHVHELQWGRFRRCPFCHKPARLTVEQRIALTFDKNSFHSIELAMQSTNKLKFINYDRKLVDSQQKTNHPEAITIGTALIQGIPVATAIMDNQFMMGTLNTTVGSGIRQIIQIANNQNLPLILFVTSGGARMQEGIFSLVQMNTVLYDFTKLGSQGNLTINILTDPTMGGVSASFGFEADYVVAEDHAQIGFSGKRVIKQTSNEVLPDEFQNAEYLLEHGQVDAVINREGIVDYLSDMLQLHGYGG